MTMAGKKVASKREVIQIRIDKEQKEILLVAARLVGQRLSVWMRGVALKEALALGVK
jgi:uncharacterized protein (DUF1778 family)